MIGNKTGDEGAEPGTAGHGSGDTALDVRTGTTALVVLVKAILVEGAEIRLSRDGGRQRGDIETKQRAA